MPDTRHDDNAAAVKYTAAQLEKDLVAVDVQLREARAFASQDGLACPVVRDALGRAATQLARVRTAMRDEG